MIRGRSSFSRLGFLDWISLGECLVASGDAKVLTGEGISVLTIGPSFQINGQAKATLNLDVDMRVGVNYHIEKAEFVFPKGGKKGGAFTPNDTRESLTIPFITTR